MRFWWRALLPCVLSASALCMPPSGLPQPSLEACRSSNFEVELQAGQGLRKPIGDGLQIWFEPIASGWILRVIPATGPIGLHDYAELATPPYQSVSPLSLSTDFAFRSQDAVGWNPRRFRFATSTTTFARLREAYEKLMSAGPSAPGSQSSDLAQRLAEAAEGKVTILDARLIPGTADQGRMAAAVSEHFATTAHTLVNLDDPKLTPLGRILWLRLRIELLTPSAFHLEHGLPAVPHLCGSL